MGKETDMGVRSGARNGAARRLGPEERGSWGMCSPPPQRGLCPQIDHIHWEGCAALEAAGLR
jgi:hypothetical protein